MTGVQTLYARTALTIVASAGGILLASSPRIHRPRAETFDRVVTSTFVISRLCFFVFLFLVLKLQLRGDVPSYYLPQAKAVLSGMVPYRDFVSSYGPLHSYLDAALFSLWHSPLVIVLFTIMVEAFVLPLWLKFGRSFVEEGTLRIACALYLTSPFSLMYVTVDGQNTIFIAVLLLLSLLLISRSRAFSSGMLVGASIVGVKFLPLLFVPAFFLTLKRRWRWLAGCVATVIAGYSFVLLWHAPVLQPFLFEGHLKTSGNLPYLAESILGVALPDHLWDAILLCAFAAVFFQIGYAARRSGTGFDRRILTFGIVALTMVLLLFSKKSAPAYLMIILYPLYLLFPRPGWLRLSGLTCFTLAALVEPSIWYSILRIPDALTYRRMILLHQPVALLFFVVEIVMLSGYSWFLWQAMQHIGTHADRVQLNNSTMDDAERVQPPTPRTV